MDDGEQWRGRVLAAGVVPGPVGDRAPAAGRGVLPAQQAGQGAGPVLPVTRPALGCRAEACDLVVGPLQPVGGFPARLAEALPVRGPLFQAVQLGLFVGVGPLVPVGRAVREAGGATVVLVAAVGQGQGDVDSGVDADLGTGVRLGRVAAGPDAESDVPAERVLDQPGAGDLVVGVGVCNTAWAAWAGRAASQSMSLRAWRIAAFTAASVRLGVDEPDLCRGQCQPGAVPELPLPLRMFRCHAITVPLGPCHRAGVRIPMCAPVVMSSTTFMSTWSSSPSTGAGP